MAKRFIDVDDEALDRAKAEFGTTTVTETVNEALRRIGRAREARIRDALDHLSRADFTGDFDPWR